MYACRRCVFPRSRLAPENAPHCRSYVDKSDSPASSRVIPLPSNSASRLPAHQGQPKLSRVSTPVTGLVPLALSSSHKYFTWSFLRNVSVKSDRSIPFISPPQGSPKERRERKTRKKETSWRRRGRTKGEGRQDQVSNKRTAGACIDATWKCGTQTSRLTQIKRPLDTSNHT